jgi:hypothetical protein
MIDDETIKKIKDAASIVDVIGDFYTLRKRGTEYECRCPFHEDKHLGSFKISPRKNYAKCFSCGWQGGPVDFLMEHEKLSFIDAIRWLGKKYSFEVEGADQMDVKPSQPRESVPELPMLVLPEKMWRLRFGLSMENPFGRWLYSINWDACQRNRILDMLTDYRIGESRNGMVIYWQIDEQQCVRTGKMMLYKADGHRDKESRYNFDWIHAALYRDPRTGYSADKTDMKTCLFGLHLLDKYTKPGVEQTVCIVESEKTAIIMAIAYGNHANQVWMACGGLSNINRDKLAPIIRQHRHICLYPDRDGVAAWKQRAEQLHYDRISVDTDPVLKWWKPEDGEKADIADVVVRMMNTKKIYKTVSEVVEDMPAVQAMHEKLNLEIIEQSNDRSQSENQR